MTYIYIQCKNMSYFLVRCRPEAFLVILQLFYMELSAWSVPRMLEKHFICFVLFSILRTHTDPLRMNLHMSVSFAYVCVFCIHVCNASKFDFGKFWFKKL